MCVVYADFIRWLGLQDKNPQDMTLLSRGEGKRETDSITLHACPERDSDNNYHILFFSHGLRYGFVPENSDARLKDVKSGDRLFPTFDVQNPRDEEAVLLRTDDPIQFVGYCPRYLAHDFKALQKQTKNFRITVEQVNLDAPQDLSCFVRLRRVGLKDLLHVAENNTSQSKMMVSSRWRFTIDSDSHSAIKPAQIGHSTWPIIFWDAIWDANELFT
jgi:hypothetical protein